MTQQNVPVTELDEAPSPEIIQVEFSVHGVRQSLEITWGRLTPPSEESKAAMIELAAYAVQQLAKVR